MITVASASYNELISELLRKLHDIERQLTLQRALPRRCKRNLHLVKTTRQNRWPNNSQIANIHFSSPHQVFVVVTKGRKEKKQR